MLDLNETERNYQVAADEGWQGCGEHSTRLLDQVPALVEELRGARAEVKRLQQYVPMMHLEAQADDQPR